MRMDGKKAVVFKEREGQVWATSGKWNKLSLVTNAVYMW